MEKSKTFVEICYNRKETFPESKREERKAFYLEGALACDGSEAERYLKMYSDLCEGLDVINGDE